MSLRQEAQKAAATQQAAADADAEELRAQTLAHRTEQVRRIFEPVAIAEEVRYLGEITLQVLVKRYTRDAYLTSSHLEVVESVGSHFRVDDVDVFAGDGHCVQPLVACSACTNLTNAREFTSDEKKILGHTVGEQVHCISVPNDVEDPDTVRREWLINKLGEIHGGSWLCGPCQSRKLAAACQHCGRPWA